MKVLSNKPIVNINMTYNTFQKKRKLKQISILSLFGIFHRKIFIFLTKIFYLLINFLFSITYNNPKNVKYKRYFDNILPKIILENKTIPSLEEIFNSRILFIPSENLTGEYIKFIRPVNETEEKKHKNTYSERDINIYLSSLFRKRKYQYNYIDFAKLCLEEKLLDSNNSKYDHKPIISIIVPSYNKEDILLKSIRSTILRKNEEKNYRINS